MEGVYDMDQPLASSSRVQFGRTRLSKQYPEGSASMLPRHSYPELRSGNSMVPLQGALWSPHYEVCRFAFLDTILSLVLAVPPLIRYDTTHRFTVTEPPNPRTLESLYGAPFDILVFLGKINAWRTSRWMGLAKSNTQEWEEAREQIEWWQPEVEYIDEPSNVIGRFAIQEAWRQSALIYLYMGIYALNSADLRVEAAVRQVVRLCSIIRPGAYLERHLLLPSFIAGVAARQEQHRAILRSK
ncbi:hypothetical protein FRC09_005644, partial [Ceratobasidium sp. 395]